MRTHRSSLILLATLGLAACAPVHHSGLPEGIEPRNAAHVWQRPGAGDGAVWLQAKTCARDELTAQAVADVANNPVAGVALLPIMLVAQIAVLPQHQRELDARAQCMRAAGYTLTDVATGQPVAR